MALEKQANSGMSLKQKAMMGAVVVIFLVVIWQVVGLMGGGTSVPPVVVSKPVANQGAKSAGTMSSSTMSAPSSANNGQPAQQQVELKQAPVVNDPAFLQQQQENAQKYVGKINDLEDLKIQRAIAETNQAIATAKLATVTAEKNISDLLTKPSMPEVSAATYANKLASQGAQGTGETITINTPQVQYTVISVSMQLGRWNAVIGSQGKLYNVVVGDVLTPDNSVVTSINKNGVMLRKNGQSRKVSIMSAI